MSNLNAVKRDAFDAVGSKQQYAGRLAGLTAYERHKLFVDDYMRFYGQHQQGANAAGPGPGSQALAGVRTDFDALRDGYRFIRTAQDDAKDTWETKLCKKYYDRLFKEYCIADLSRYKESKLGLRWRVQKEVVSGKGQFSCGAKGCEERDGLASFEVNFAYQEAGEKKQALVKLRVCPSCAYKLNYKREKAFERAGGKRRRSDHAAGDSKVARRADELPGLTAEDIERAAAHVAAPPQALGSQAGGQAAVGVAGGTAQQQQEQASVLPGDDSIWEAKPVQEVTAEEEFDKYFEDMFL